MNQAFISLAIFLLAYILFVALPGKRAHVAVAASMATSVSGRLGR